MPRIVVEPCSSIYILFHISLSVHTKDRMETIYNTTKYDVIDVLHLNGGYVKISNGVY